MDQEEAPAQPGSARADAVTAGRREQQQRRASSPVVSSSCLTDASHEQHGREQETTSRGA